MFSGGYFDDNSTFFTNATNALKNGNRVVGIGWKSNLETNTLASFEFTSTPRFAFRYPYVTISNSVGGTTTPASGFYAVTNPAQIQANASIGYHFKAWTNGSTTNPINLIVANQDVTIGAIFEADIFRISGAKSLTIPPSGSATYYYVPYVNDVDPSIYGYNVSLTYQKNLLIVRETLLFMQTQQKDQLLLHICNLHQMAVIGALQLVKLPGQRRLQNQVWPDHEQQLGQLPLLKSEIHSQFLKNKSIPN